MAPKKAFIAILAVLILALVGGGTIYYFADTYLRTKANDISELKANVDILDQKLVNARQAISEYNDLKYLDSIIDNVLPPEKIQSDVVGQLVKFADMAGVDINNINFAPTNNTDQAKALTQTLPVKGISGINKLPVNVGVTGTYSQVLTFLREVETNRRIMQIDSVGLSPTNNIFTAALTINVYVRVK